MTPTGVPAPCFCHAVGGQPGGIDFAETAFLISHPHRTIIITLLINGA